MSWPVFITWSVKHEKPVYTFKAKLMLGYALQYWYNVFSFTDTATIAINTVNKVHIMSINHLGK